MQRWPDGSPIEVFVLPKNHKIHRNYCLYVLGTFHYVLQQQWDQQTFTGSGEAPTEIATTYQLHKKASFIPGSIGSGRLNPTFGSWIQFVGGEPKQSSPETDSLVATLGARWKPTKNWLLAAEIHGMRGTAGIPRPDNNINPLYARTELFVIMAGFRF
ncbi:MAG: hypothetical protein ACI9OO_001069 [Bacteroidia bacterium]|jgi:hypothetical protein